MIVGISGGIDAGGDASFEWIHVDEGVITRQGPFVVEVVRAKRRNNHLGAAFALERKSRPASAASEARTDQPRRAPRKPTTAESKNRLGDRDDRRAVFALGG